MTQILKINLRGGIVSPGGLLQILACLRACGISQVRFGLRQQILVACPQSLTKRLWESLQPHQLEIEIDSDQYPNIISSYCAEEVFPTGQWLSEGIYQDIFDEFDFSPKLKVNISDDFQSFTPFFTGNLNFIASPIPNFWYLYVRYKQSNQLFRWSSLIFTNEISRVTKALENQLLQDSPPNPESLENWVDGHLSYISQDIEQDLQVPQFRLPYYEGFNRYGNKTWLGIYRRNEAFSVDFLEEICQLCAQTRIGQICVTPWKSLIVKNIDSQGRVLWDALLGKYGINVRHAANELNWQVEDNSLEGLELKKSIIRAFDDEDVRTFGLCFAVQTRPKSEVFGSVIIKKSDLLRLGNTSMLSTYDIYHTSDFNPNTRQLVLFQKGISRLNLSEVIRRLTKKYYALKMSDEKPVILHEEKIDNIQDKRRVHQCPHCLSIYDSEYGDIFNSINPGVAFKDLPSDYQCGICEGSKQDFVEVSMGVPEKV